MRPSSEFLYNVYLCSPGHEGSLLPFPLPRSKDSIYKDVLKGPHHQYKFPQKPTEKGINTRGRVQQISFIPAV